MAIAPELSPFNPQKNPIDKTSDRADSAAPDTSAGSPSVFTPITPVSEPVLTPEPENQENPFVALSPEVTSVGVPPKKTPAPMPAATVPLPQKPVSRAQKPSFLLNEKISIAIAPEFIPAPPPPAPKTEMDFSLDYKNPEAQRLLSKPVRNRSKDQTCYKCRKQTPGALVLDTDKGPLCPKCWNPYIHGLISNIYFDRGPASGALRVLVAALHFFAAWMVPLLPAIICYVLLVRTGFGGFFEDFAVVFAAPTAGGMIFVFLLLAGIFLIPAGIVSVSQGSTIAGSLARINPLLLFTLVRSALPGYFAVFCILAGTVLLNLAGLALCAEAGGEGGGSMLALPLALCMSGTEMALFRLLRRGKTARAALLCAVVCLLMPQCSFLDPAPVDDGTVIAYSIRDEFGTRSVCTLRFGKAPRGLLELMVDRRDSVEIPSVSHRGTPGLFDTLEPVVTPDGNGRILVSRFLKRRGGHRLVLNEFGPPWLPPCQLTTSRRFELGPRFGAAIVDTIVLWRNRKVCVITIGGRESTIAGTSYYSAATGVLLKSSIVNSSTRYFSPDSSAGLVLSGSNIPGI